MTKRPSGSKSVRLGSRRGTKLTRGTVLSGKYKLMEPLGRGSSAWVFMAEPKTIKSLQYAVKVLKPGSSERDDAFRRFEREASTVARLQSPNTVRIFDFGESESGVPYIVMECVRGLGLNDLIKTHGALNDLLVARIAADESAEPETPVGAPEEPEEPSIAVPINEIRNPWGN